MRTRLKLGDRVFRIEVESQSPLRVLVTEGETEREISASHSLEAGKGRILLNDKYETYFVSETSTGIWVTLAGNTYLFERLANRLAGHEESAHGGFGAPMPGKVIRVLVSAGDAVVKGQALVVMEAMKMEHRIEAPENGRILELRCKEGDVVEQGFQLLHFEEDEVGA